MKLIKVFILIFVLSLFPIFYFIPFFKANAQGQLPPESPVIESIVLEGDSNGFPITITDSHGDLWFTTLADDDNLYTTFGDGFGFGDVFADVGIARLTGTVPDFTGENIYFEVHPGQDRSENDKPSSLLSINGRMYGHFFSPIALPWIGYNVYSDDYGHTWTRVGFYKQGETPPSDASPWTSDVGSVFRCLSFVNMGKNYELNQDGFVYGFGMPRPGIWPGGIYLARVSVAEILDYEAYEYFQGMNGDQPIWSSSQFDAQPVPNLQAVNQSSAIYHPGVGRYLFFTSQDLFDAPHPWGPWTLAGSWARPPEPGWGGGYQPGIINNGIGDDYFWFSISGQPEKGAEVEYKLNLGKIIMNMVTPTPYPHCQPIGDIDCSEKVNSVDFGYLSLYWLTGNPQADLDNSGRINVDDVFIWLYNYGRRRN